VILFSAMSACEAKALAIDVSPVSLDVAPTYAADARQVKASRRIHSQAMAPQSEPNLW
jgi:hypothetical protein